MSETAIRPNSPRVTIAATSHHGLIVQIDREKLELPWTGVRVVSAGHVPAAAGAWHLALALEVEADSLEHLLIATEADRVWAALTAMLPLVFQDMPPIDAWAPVVLASSAPLSLLDQPSGKRSFRSPLKAEHNAYSDRSSWAVSGLKLPRSVPAD
ncbi:hypothetical protein [Novosphingobium sp. P6W]|uniref:hypothetical protein n=1 Tax=Novosphingobium sp. P6W TaxID=1609758 RepID=UPI0006983209|nr:hypothetical protein [Novosphingobium sp. P6W]AXB75876.1 hypothetical protein TQ38_004550 [Novosphingobium sp. P6W]